MPPGVLFGIHWRRFVGLVWAMRCRLLSAQCWFFELHQLPSGVVFKCRREQMHELPVGNVPSIFGVLHVLDLRRGDLFLGGGQRLHELRGRVL